MDIGFISVILRVIEVFSESAFCLCGAAAAVVYIIRGGRHR